MWRIFHVPFPWVLGGGLKYVVLTESHQGSHTLLKFSCWLTENACWHCQFFGAGLSTQTKARVISCITAQKSLGLGASVWSMKSAGWSLLNLGGASYHLEASCWTRSSMNATACQWAHCRALELLRPSLIRWVPIDTLQLAFSSFHQWGWMVFSISAWST